MSGSLGLYFSAMGGFFLDSTIRSIMKSVRRENHTNTAENWPLIDAKISNSGLGAAPSRPGVTYSYVVNGETWYGSCVGFPLRDTDVEKARSVPVQFHPCTFAMIVLTQQRAEYSIVTTQGFRSR